MTSSVSAVDETFLGCVIVEILEGDGIGELTVSVGS